MDITNFNWVRDPSQVVIITFREPHIHDISLLPPILVLNGQKYQIRGCVFHKACHFTSIVKFRGQFYVYDDLSAELRVVVLSMDPQEPVLAVYCAIFE